MSPLASSSLVLPTDVFICPPLCAAAQGSAFRGLYLPCGRLRRASGGRHEHVRIWIAAAFGKTALWALVVVVNKQILESVTPVAVNFFIRLVAIGGLLGITVPLTVSGLWSNGFGINAEAAGWIALGPWPPGSWPSTPTTSRCAASAWRSSRPSPARTRSGPPSSPGSSSARRSARQLAGMAVTMAGVVPISRWMDEGEDAPGAELAGAAALAAAAHGEVLPAGRDRRGARRGGARRCSDAGARACRGAKARLIGLAVLTAAGWGLDRAHRPGRDRLRPGHGQHDALSQVCGALMLGGVLLLRRAPLAARPLTPAERRHAIWLIVLAGLLEASVSVLFYLSIVAIGPVLTMLTWPRRRSSPSSSASSSSASVPACA